MGGLLHLVQRGGAWAGWNPLSPLLAVPNVTAPYQQPVYQSLYCCIMGLLLCGFNVAIKWLILNVNYRDMFEVLAELM